MALSGLLATPMLAQDGPRRLFPGLPPAGEGPSPSAPAAPSPAEPSLSAPIQVEDLAPPSIASLGLAAAQDELGGPLWPQGAPPHLIPLVQRLPVEIAEPTLRALQKALLLAPGPSRGALPELLFVRLERLLAMGEAEAALELLALIPEGSEGNEVEVQRLKARLAADRIEPACAMSPAEPSPPWPEARLVCAALAQDAAAVERALRLIEEHGRRADPVLVGLARAYVAGKGRFALPAEVADDPLLLPLLRRAPLDVAPKAVRHLPLPVRRALDANPNLPSAVRAAAGAPPRPGPSARPELNGGAPGDWAAALASVPAPRRAAYLALVDGLGLQVPEPLWAGLMTEEAVGETPAPALFSWRGLETALAAGRRGESLLHLLHLLDGRPEAAAPVTMRAGVQALGRLGLDPFASALAAGTGGALGL